MSRFSQRIPLRRALTPLAIVSLLLCAGISESQADDTDHEAAATDLRPVVVFVDPQAPFLDDQQRQILAAYRWARTADPAAKIRVVNLTDTPWDEASRRRVLAETRLTPEQAVFLHIPDSGPIPPDWPGHKPALAAARLN
jgi:hypothetical protein